jgi:hypothetical protein
VNLTSFWKLNTDERAQLLWDKATFMTSAQYLDLRVNLYYWKGNLIEVWYNPALNKITKIIPMQSSRLYKGYFKGN